MSTDSDDRVTRALAAVEAAATAKAAQPRTDRDWLVADAAARVGLPAEYAADIAGDRPGEIQRHARKLALSLGRRSAAEDAEATARQAAAEASRPTLRPGHATDEYAYDFDADEVARRARRRD